MTNAGASTSQLSSDWANVQRDLFCDDGDQIFLLHRVTHRGWFTFGISETLSQPRIQPFVNEHVQCRSRNLDGTVGRSISSGSLRSSMSSSIPQFPLFQRWTGAAYSLRRKSDACEVSAHNNFSSKAAVFDCLSVIGFRQSTTRNFPRPLAFCPDRRNEMRKHEIFCSNPLRHRTQIGGTALPIIDWRGHSAALVWSHDGMDRRMNDDIGPHGQLLNLIGGRRCTWRRKYIVACITADHHAPSRGVHTIGSVTRGMS